VADIKDPKLARLVELAQNGPGKDKYPQADAVVALEDDAITYKPDGSVVHKHHSIVKLIDPQRGKEKFADVRIAFDSERETLTIDTARTVNADGEPHVASNEEIGDIVPPYLADATIYSGVRERVISFPAVDAGSVIELEYTRTTRSTPDSPRGGVEMLARWNPVIERIVSITAPTKITPQMFTTAGLESKPKQTASADSRTWTWRFADLPDRHPEYGAPTEEAVLPRLVYGFVNAWPDVLEPVAGRFLAKAVPSPLPADVIEQAKAIVAGATTDTEKAQKLFAFVAHDIRSVQLPLGAAGYEPHGPEIVLANRYADERDKVGLLLALAASQGIKGRPVLVRTGKVPVVASVPTLAQFDRMIAKLEIDGKDVWVDPKDEHGQFGVAFAGQDNMVLPLDKGGTELGMRPPLDPETSVSAARINYALAAGGDLQATYSYELTGYYANMASQQMRALKGELLDQFFQQSAAGVSASALDKKHTVGDTLAVTGPFAVTQEISIPGYSAAQAGMRVFELPPLSLGVASDPPSASLSTRKTPLWVGVPRTERRQITVQIPAGWEVSYVPPLLEGSTGGVRYTQGCEVSGQTVTCKGEIKLDKLIVAVDQYAAFREAITKLQAYERRIVLLTKS
jgi:transglutaminase-like putative cysteine protease